MAAVQGFAPLDAFRSPIESARNYSFSKFRRDLFAGLTVSVVEVPQSMAYALIAGVPPQYGLYTSILQGIIGALLSSSEHVTTGPTNTQSLLIASTVTRVAGGDPALYLQMVFALTLFKGLIQLAFAFARLGDMVRYVSRSVIVGIAAGAGVLIIVGQVPNFLGINALDLAHERQRFPGVIGAFERVAAHGGDIHGRAIAIAIGSIAILLIVRTVNRLLPAALIAIVCAAAATALLGWSEADLPLIGRLPRSFPSLFIPRVGIEHAQDLLGGALALALLGSLESVAIAKAIAIHSGERINPNQEFFTQGIKNALTSFFQCIPGSVSFTRSALDYAAGAATRFAAVFNGLFVAAIFYLFGGLARFIPLASLAAVLFVIAFGLIDFAYFARTLRTSRNDAMVAFATAGAALLVPLEYAIFIGIFLNIALYLRSAVRLHMAEMIQAPGGGILEMPIHDRTGHRQVVLLQVEGDLFFGVADELQDRLTHLVQAGPKVVIFRMKRTHSIDSTALHVVEQFAKELRTRNRYVLLCGVRPELMRVLKSFGLYDLIGRENIFEASAGVFTSVKQALHRARELTGASIDEAPVDSELRSEEFIYEI